MSNKKTFTVKEFDTIISGAKSGKEDKYYILEDKVFSELKVFIEDFTQNNQNEIENIFTFFKLGYKPSVRHTITINNYVGIIELPSGYQIEILPKIDFVEEDENYITTKKIFLNMLKSLREFQSKSFSLASLDTQKMDLYEIFISMFIKEASDVVRKGLKSNYVTTEDNLTFYKGKMDISKHIKHNLSHKERFYMHFDEYSLNRPENKIIKATLLYLLRKSTNLENQKEIKRLLIYFDEVDASTNYDVDFSNIVFDRTNRIYEKLISWSRIFLKNKSFATFSGVSTGTALLFPMETIFEEYVAGKVKQIFEKNGWKVSTQDRTYHLFEQPRQRFLIRPDIVLEKDNKYFVLDTKWKKLVNNPQQNYGISHGDMYQMYAYSNKYISNNRKAQVILLYPKNIEINNTNIEPYRDDQGVEVRISFVDLSSEEVGNNLLKLVESIG